MTFVREHRYLVQKRKDVQEALSAHEAFMLGKLLHKISQHRKSKGKQPLQCVVVESDWPEYESTWKAIEERVNSQK